MFLKQKKRIEEVKLIHQEIEELEAKKGKAEETKVTLVVNK
jgi:hypothetical protein